MASFSFATKEQDGCVLIDVQGYFAAEAGQALETLVDGLLRAGKILLVFDFTPCTIVSSPGVAALMELTLKITEDFQGRAALCGLDQLKRNVFSMAGITSVAPEAPDRAAALLTLKK